MKRRRTRDPEIDGVYIPISFKISSTLLENIDEVWKNDDSYTGRAHFIENACKYYLSLEPCPHCGKLHEKTAKLCSFCCETFDPYDKLIESLTKTVELTKSFITLLEKSIKNINSQIDKIDWYLEKQDSKIKETISLLTSSIYDDLKKSRDELVTIYNILSTYKHPTDIAPEISKFLKRYEIFNAFLPIEGLLKSYPKKTFPIENQAICVAYSYKVCEEILENHSSYRTLTIEMFYNFLTTDITAMNDKYLPIMNSLINQLSSIMSIIDYVIKNNKS